MRYARRRSVFHPFPVVFRCLSSYSSLVSQNLLQCSVVWVFGEREEAEEQQRALLGKNAYSCIRSVMRFSV